MKTSFKITLLLAGLAAAAIPLIDAADAAASPAPGQGPGQAQGRRPLLRAMMQRQAMRQRIAHRLGLTPDQISQLKAGRAKTVASIKSIRADASLTLDQKKAKVRDTLQAARGELRGVLTTDQQQQLDKIREHLRSMLRDPI